PHLQENDHRNNNRIAWKMTYLLFLSRLKILRFCLKVPGSQQTFNSATWTIPQTCPHVFGNDVFDSLFKALLPVLSVQQLSFTGGELLGSVQDELKAVQLLLINHGKLGRLPIFSDNNGLLVFIDEAQVLGQTNKDFFDCMDTYDSYRPLLSPILFAFRASYFYPKLGLITCGNELNIYMTDSVSRNIVKYHDVEFADICAIEFPSWTGRESIEAYVAGLRGLLPTDDAKQALDILLRPKVIQAIAERLGGRFRPAITAIERIIADGDPDGWQGAIDETEAELVLYDLRRKRGNLCSELARAKMAAPRYLTNFKEPRIVLEALR
ncbi:hypothetical protein BGX29_004720, partial [Mortierella sp. GBA35]